jgi:hypothetical protein
MAPLPAWGVTLCALLALAACARATHPPPTDDFNAGTATVRWTLPDRPLPPRAVPPSAPARGLDIVPNDDPIAEMAHIRGVLWPLVRNAGRGRAYPSQEGIASFYHEGQQLATGERFDPHGLSAAHRTLPFGTIVRVTRLDTGASVVVVINDRGPYVDGRIIDLSLGAAVTIDMIEVGLVRCRVEVLAYPLIETMGPRGNG